MDSLELIRDYKIDKLVKTYYDIDIIKSTQKEVLLQPYIEDKVGVKYLQKNFDADYFAGIHRKYNKEIYKRYSFLLNIPYYEITRKNMYLNYLYYYDIVNKNNKVKSIMSKYIIDDKGTLYIEKNGIIIQNEKHLYKSTININIDKIIRAWIIMHFFS